MRSKSMKATALAVVTSMALALTTSVAFSQDKIELIYSDTVSEGDVRTTILREAFGVCLGDEFDFQSFHGATLFAQGTELTSMQRGNLDLASLAIFDFYNQVPATTILGTAYLFRDYDHMRSVYDGDVLADIYAQIEEATQVKILSNPYIGTRHVNIRGDREIMVPADLEGIKLRMPGGEGWQFVGQALGANATPLAFTEVYTALQTGAIDGQDNPLPADRSMKFYEVTDQIILTGHLIAANQFTISLSKWNSMNDSQQATVQDCALNFQSALDQSTLDQEAELVEFFIGEGLKVYEPNKEAFRNHVLDVYMNSQYSADWPEGLLDDISAL